MSKLCIACFNTTDEEEGCPECIDHKELNCLSTNEQTKKEEVEELMEM